HEQLTELRDALGSGRGARYRGGRIPKARRPAQRGDQRDGIRLPTEPGGELRDERPRRTDAAANLDVRLADGERHPERQHRRVPREARTPRRMILPEDEGTDLLAACLTLLMTARADDRAHLRRDDVTVRVDRNQEPAPLERETHATPRRRSASRTTEA